MFWSLPHQVDMVSRYFSHLEVLGSTGTCWTNEGMKQQIRLFDPAFNEVGTIPTFH